MDALNQITSECFNALRQLRELEGHVSSPEMIHNGFVGFIVMLTCAFLFERNLRKLGRAGWQQMTESMRAGNLREYFGDAGNRLRRRFKRDE